MKKFIYILIGVGILACSETPKQLESGVELANFDQSVRLQDDLFRHVNGQWLATKEIPSDQSNYGSFTELSDQAELDIRKIIEEASQKSDAAGSPGQQIGDLYKSVLDTLTIEKLGLSPVQTYLDQIAAISSETDLARVMGELRPIGIQYPFSHGVSLDVNNANQYIVYFSQSGLSLPDRNYYLSDDEKFVQYRTDYDQYLARLHQLAGFENGKNIAKKIIEMETAIADKHWTRAQSRDRDKTNNKMAAMEMVNMSKGFDWITYLRAAGLSSVDSVIVRQDSYYTNLGSLFNRFSMEDWKMYLRYKLLSEYSDILPSAFADLNFDFFRRTLRGVEAQAPRWKQGVQTVNGGLGMVVGKLYAEKHFKPEAKLRMVQLVENLRAAYRDRIMNLDWMGEETKQKALVKLEKFTYKIGYPDVWKDYSDINIKPDALVENMMNIAKWNYQDNLAKLGQPKDRTEWFMSPQTVNAYYSSTMNEVVFPAAILQPPFFNMNADDAVNYGAIGAVIGHEFTHGFDDQGRKSDGDGNQIEWWTEQDETEFVKRADRIVEQYDTYNPIDNLHIDGRLTLGENIADLGGLTIAYYAYQKSLNGNPSTTIDGFTGEQRFFIGWAQIWRRLYRDDEMRARLKTDSHSPSEYRVNGVVVNMPEFQKAFNLQPTDQLFKPEDEIVLIW